MDLEIVKALLDPFLTFTEAIREVKIKRKNQDRSGSDKARDTRRIRKPRPQLQEQR